MKKAIIGYLVFATVCILSTIILLTCVGCNQQKSIEKQYNAYKLAVRLEESGKLYGEMDFFYINQTDSTLEYLDFNLFGNAFREDAKLKPVEPSFTDLAYYAGKSYGYMDIISVENCKKYTIVGTDENILRVELLHPLPIGQSVQIKINYTLQLAKVNHRTGITEKTMNLGNFYPIVCVYENGKGFFHCAYYSNGDPFYSESANYTVTLSVPIGYTVASSAKEVQKTTHLGQTVYEYTLQAARDFAFVFSKEFTKLQTSVQDIELNYLFYQDENAAQTLQLIQECMQYFQNTFGEYIFDSYTVVQTGFCYGGMEYPALSMISDSLMLQDYQYTIVHETAHQWWYSAVGNNEVTEAWLDEGLTEFSTALFFKNHKAYKISYDGMMQTARQVYRTIYSLNDQLAMTKNSSLNRAIHEYGSLEYYVLNYVKAMLLYDDLTKACGEKTVLKNLKKYYAENKYSIATKQSLCNVFSKRGQKIIESFVDGSVVI